MRRTGKMPVPRAGETPASRRKIMPESVNILEQLSAYLDGELDAADARVVEAAAAADAAVARELERLRTAREWVRRLPREQAPEDFALRVMAQAERKTLLVHEEPARPPAGRRWRRTFATAAAVLLILSGGLAVSVIVRQGLQPEGSSPQVAAYHAARQPDVVVRYGHSQDAPDVPLESDVLAKLDSSSRDDRLVGDTRYNIGKGGNGRGGRDANRELNEWPEEFQDLARTFPLEEWRRGTLGEAAGKSNELDRIMGVVARGPESGAKSALEFNYAQDEMADEEDLFAAMEAADADGDADAGGVFRGSAPGGAFKETLGDALAMLISTDDVAQTRRQVEKIFADNGIVRLSAQPLDVPSLPPTLSQMMANHLAYEDTMVRRARTGERPVDVVILQADVTPEQADAVAKALAELRRGQSTPQRPVEEARERNKLYLARADRDARYNAANNVPGDPLDDYTYNALPPAQAGDHRVATAKPQAEPEPAQTKPQPATVKEEQQVHEQLVAMNTQRNVQHTERIKDRQPQKTASPKDEESATASAPMKAKAPTEPASRPELPGPSIAQQPTTTGVQAEGAQTADQKIQPTTPHLQRMIVTVEYRQLPSTTTGPTIKPARTAE